MNLLGNWHPKFWRRTLLAASGKEVHCAAAPASGLDDLQTRLIHWSHLWSHDSDAGTRTEAQDLVAKRLSHWMERCLGQRVQSSLSGKGGQISLASSTPIFTAFLGRRATRELSRRVLQDI
jgi:hypothetical protein